MKRLRPSPAFLVPLAVIGCKSRVHNESKSSPRQTTEAAVPAREECAVVIAGGTTAATAAALAAARELEKNADAAATGDGDKGGPKGRVCLFEPTNWPGGQLTASGVAAVDFDHHTKEFGFTRGGKPFNIGTLAANHSKVFRSWMKALGTKPEDEVFTMDANPGRCWVSVRCFEPRAMVDLIKASFKPYEDKGLLKVWYNTVPKSVVASDRKITSITAIQRTLVKKGTKAPRSDDLWDLPLSAVVGEWYDSADTENFTKKTVTFVPTGDLPTVIDATEWGEILALSDASYTQGLEGLEGGKDTCGQAIIYPLALTIAATPVELPKWFEAEYADAVPRRARELYSHSGGGRTWDMNWRYRRMKATGEGGVWSTPPSPGDTTQINVYNGNDYKFDYLFWPKDVARKQAREGKWAGGVNHAVLKNAEIHSLGYLQFMRTAPGDESAFQFPKLEEKNFQKDGVKNEALVKLTKHVQPANTFGTVNGLSKVPYMRDTRRSVGVGGYQISYEAEFLPGARPNDAVGIGVYAADQHPVIGCKLPEPSKPHPRPSYIPLRALTNKSFDNLLVSGKTMAQDFLTNAATRLHPIEFASGTAAGVLAVYMHDTKLGSADVVESESASAAVAKRVAADHGPVEWTK